MSTPLAKGRGRDATRRLVLAALMAALLMVGKQAMSGLPNIEPVSFLVVLYTLELPRETPGAIAVFILLQGVLYGFGIWWFMYLYVWYILMLVTKLLRRCPYAVVWALVSGAFGLCFGALCALPYLFVRDWAFAFAWWSAGLPYDLLHAGGNFVVMLLLYHPMRAALGRIRSQLSLAE